MGLASSPAATPSRSGGTSVRATLKKRFYAKTFGFKIFVRLAAICFFTCLTVLLIFSSPYWMAGVWTGLAAGVLFYETIRFVNFSERKLTVFLQGLKQNDFTITFEEDVKSDDYDLHQAFNQLNETFKRLRSEKESQHQLLNVIVEHAAVPLVCFDETNDEVYLINNAAKELFQVPFLQKIHSLERVERSLPEFLKNTRDGEKSSFKLILGSKSIILSVTSQRLLFKNKKLKLIALTDVSSELAAREAEAWQKLLRVLAHEMSNSAIPLSTLASYLHDMVTTAKRESRNLTVEEQHDMLESLRTIDHRSKSLKEFVRNFRSINQIPEPDMIRIPLSELINELKYFFIKELEKEGIDLEIVPGEDVIIHADKTLTMQALINLVRNAIEAMDNMKDGKVIRFTVDKNGHQFARLLVADNGRGIPGEEIEQIFVPFYSTKKGGYGIGLSIAHQIMKKQKGDLSVVSVSGKGSVFTASFLR